MKSTKFAVGGDEAKIAAFSDALADSVLDEADAEEQDDSGRDERDDGKPNGDDDSSEVEGAEAPFEAKDEAATGFCPSAAGRPPMIFCYRPRYRPPGR